MSDKISFFIPIFVFFSNPRPSAAAAAVFVVKSAMCKCVKVSTSASVLNKLVQYVANVLHFTLNTSLCLFVPRVREQNSSNKQTTIQFRSITTHQQHVNEARLARVMSSWKWRCSLCFKSISLFIPKRKQESRLELRTTGVLRVLPSSIQMRRVP